MRQVNLSLDRLIVLLEKRDPDIFKNTVINKIGKILEKGNKKAEAPLRQMIECGIEEEDKISALCWLFHIQSRNGNLNKNTIWKIERLAADPINGCIVKKAKAMLKVRKEAPNHLSFLTSSKS